MPLDVKPARRSVVLSGTLANVAVTFGIDFEDLMLFQSPNGDRFRGRTGPLFIPAELDGMILAVFGIDNRAQARVHFRRCRAERNAMPGPGDTDYLPPTVASLYDFRKERAGQDKLSP
jgi:kumamolisin